jgi:hypothetical protein
VVACSVAIPLAAAKVVGDEDVALGQGLSPFLNSPVSSLIRAVALAYTPVFSGVLALYVVLMLWAPLVIFLASRSPASALLASIAVYVGGRSRAGGDGDGWYFNPFAWQLVFAIGIICALRWRSGLPRPQGRLVVLAVAVILGAAILSIRAMGLEAAAFAHLDLVKSELGVMRLVHFLALAYVLAAVTTIEPWAARMRRVVESGVGQSLQGMGRNSLLFFALGSVASAGGRSLVGAAHSLAAPQLSVHLIGFVYTAAAVAGMFALIRRMERTEIDGATPATPTIDRGAPVPQAKDAGLAPLLAPVADQRKSSPSSV